MEPVNKHEGEKLNHFSYVHLTKVTPLSKYLAAFIFICLPFLGGFIGYRQGQLDKVVVKTVVIEEALVSPATARNNANEAAKDIASTSSIEAQLSNHQSKFILTPTAKFEDTFPEQTVSFNGKVISTQLGCMSVSVDDYYSAFVQAKSNVSGLDRRIPSVSLIKEVVSCWFGGGGQDIILFQSSSTATPAVVGFERSECGMLPETECTGYGDLKTLY